MKVLDVEGKTIDDAKKKAMVELGIDDPSTVKIEVIDEGKTGIFGFGVSRPAKVRISYSEDDLDVVQSSNEIILNILEKMGIKGKLRDLREDNSRIYIELESEYSGLIIGKQGKTLEALQFLVNLIVNHKTGNEKKRIILDIESYRAKREKALRKLSREIAFKVINTGKPWSLEPMNPFERRLIHLTLQKESRVTTESEGQGIYRKVKIYPANSR